jgi:hypothetical protein
MENIKEIRINTGDYITNLYDIIKSFVSIIDGRWEMSEYFYNYINKYFKVKTSNEVKDHITKVLNELNKYELDKFDELYDKIYDKILEEELELMEKFNNKI